ncbi:MAG: hypothetical protein ACOYNL_04445 [Rickettsiales bacterium]
MAGVTKEQLAQYAAQKAAAEAAAKKEADDKAAAEAAAKKEADDKAVLEARDKTHLKIDGKDPLAAARDDVFRHLTPEQQKIAQPALEAAAKEKQGRNPYLSDAVGKALVEKISEAVAEGTARPTKAASDKIAAYKAVITTLEQADHIALGKQQRKTEVARAEDPKKLENDNLVARFSEKPPVLAAAPAAAPDKPATEGTTIKKGDTLTAIALRDKEGMTKLQVQLGDKATKQDVINAYVAIAAKISKIDDIDMIFAGNKVAALTDESIKQGVEALKTAKRIDGNGHVNIAGRSTQEIFGLKPGSTPPVAGEANKGRST